VSEDRYAIAGAGLAGSLLATALGKAGHEVTVYDKRPDPRQAGTGGGRSINLALSTRGIEALREVGLAQEILADAIPMHGRMIHALDGGLAYQAYGRRGQAIHSVSRGGLNLRLIEMADRLPNVTMRFEHGCRGYDAERGALLLEDGGGACSEVTDAIVVGADGAFSAVRGSLQRRDRFDYRQDFLEHGYKELTIPARDGDYALPPNALHIWPRGTFMMIALPNPDRSFTCTLFWPFSQFEALETADEITAFFEKTFPDAVPLMPTLVEDYRANPTSSLVTVRCYPWNVADRCVLIGDACHAVVPFYGQGMNAAFEDVTVLGECLREFPEDRERAFREYGERRKRNVDTLADLAIGNYLEMRDHVASPWFRLRKKVDRTLGLLLPSVYRPLYEMVSFSRTPYAEAVARAKRQDRVVLGVASGLLVAVLVVLLILLGVLG
jgi:kynurenine 3-monooxygenase